MNEREIATAHTETRRNMMSNTNQAKHTPAPWSFDEEEDDLGSMAIQIEHEGVPIATVLGSDDFPCADEDAEDEIADEAVANARLIACAPEMLAALKDIFGFLRAQGYNTDLIKAVIARAEGEP